MQRWKFLAALLATLFALPYALLMAAGTVWLFQNHLLPHFLIVTVVAMFLGWLLTGRFKQSRPMKRASNVEPSELWSPAGEAAWREVQQVADEAEATPPPLDQPDRWWELARTTLTVVAKQFHPKSDQPALEVPLPDALQIVELVAHDMRISLREKIPGSHMVTINDFNRLKRLAHWGQRLYMGYRIGYLALNPIAAIVREMRDAASGEVLDRSADEVHRWATGYFVRKTGFYAIQLYSGQLRIDDEAFKAFTTRDSSEHAGDADARNEQVTGEPLRILVIGQTKAGKSSLINALFGEMKAATDVIPLTDGIEPFVLKKEGLDKAIIFDTAGYAVLRDEASSEVNEAMLTSDLILLVCSARNAAREPDRAVLADLQQRFERDRNRAMPAVLVVLTHIDSLRPFQEWSPPYNLVQPNSPKAQSIASAIEAISSELGIPAERVVPVCLLPERIYNVEEGLMPAMLASLPAAQRSKLLRTLKQFRDEEYWHVLWDQARNSGRLLAKAGAKWVGKTAVELVDRLPKS